MLRRLVFNPEKYLPGGGATAKGMIDAYGKPRLDIISSLIREAVQNSWDARIQNTRSPARVKFSAEYIEFTATQIDVLKKNVFPGSRGNHPVNSSLKYGLKALVLRDTGTKGLTGPVFVVDNAPGQEDRFNNFCRMFGKAADVALSGGTYGFGKAVFYNASSCETIIVFSRCRTKIGFQERFIVLSNMRDPKGALETGRFSWGLRDRKYQNCVAPVLDDDAHSMALEIGFRSFGPDTGTAIMILDPNIIEKDDVDGQKATTKIAENLAIWFWPRMLGAADDEGILEFSVKNLIKHVPVPDPRSEIPFSLYAEALDNLVAYRKKGISPPNPYKVTVIETHRPIAILGYLSLVKSTRRPRKEFEIATYQANPDEGAKHVFAEQIGDESSFKARCHHIALMRTPGQVVKYLSCTEHPNAALEYCGLFLADGKSENGELNDVNNAFASSEPPAHDDWCPDQLIDRSQKIFVNMALKRISSEANDYSEANAIKISSDSQQPLGEISRELASLMGGSTGDGASPPLRESNRSSSHASRDLFLVPLSDGEIQEFNGQIVFVLPFEIKGQILFGSSVTVQAFPKIIVAGGGSESDSPAGTEIPVVIGWKKLDGRLVTKDTLYLGPGEEGGWSVQVSVPKDAVIGLSLSLSGGMI